MGGIAIYIGAAVLIAIGGGIAIRPTTAASYLTRDDDGNPVPVSSGAIWRTRLAGLALIVVGGVLMWYGPAAFQGPVDMGVP